MASIFAFTCTCCGKVHEGSPSLAFSAPWHYSTLSEEQRSAMATIDSDLCTITHDEGTDYFVRCVLEISIDGVSEPFTWGVWVSLSEKSFKRYVETTDDPVEGEVYFGWFCNQLTCYPETLSLPTDVLVQPRGKRPHLRLHRGGGDEHPLVRDQLNGISVTRAQEIAEAASHPISAR
jgi:hypothetical protein